MGGQTQDEDGILIVPSELQKDVSRLFARAEAEKDLQLHNIFVNLALEYADAVFEMEGTEAQSGFKRPVANDR